MSRILKAYRTRFYQLLRPFGARRLDDGAERLVNQARRVSMEEGIALVTALDRVGEALAARSPAHSKQRRRRGPADIQFFCDAGLGGLARWLRAAGYQAAWQYGIADELLVNTARQIHATILTTDSLLMERRVVRDEIVPTLWLPPTLSIAQQLEKVFCEFGLSLGQPRCMRCGGELIRVDKESCREQIPPRTYRWLNEYFRCTGCGKLLWHGTHWARIFQRLQELQSRCAPGAPAAES